MRRAFACEDSGSTKATRMTASNERRRAPRVVMPQPTPVRARARGTLEVRLLDLSLSGARIEHLGLLRPGASCELEFPAALSPLILSGRVVRSAVVGDEQGPASDRQLRYETGLAFVDVTPDQQAVLTRILEWIALGGTTEGLLTMS